MSVCQFVSCLSVDRLDGWMAVMSVACLCVVVVIFKVVLYFRNLLS